MKPFLVDVPYSFCSSTARNSYHKCLNKSGMPVPPSFSSIRTDHAGEHDLPGIKACREVTDQIDWDLQSPSHVSGEELWLRPIGIHLTKMGLFYG